MRVCFQFYEVIVRVPLSKPLNWYMLSPEAVVQRCSVKKLFLKFQACNFIEKKTLAQVFSCEFFEISKSIFFTEQLWMTVSESIDKLFVMKFLRQLRCG